MIKDLTQRQAESKHSSFAHKFTRLLNAIDVTPSPKVVATAINLHFKSAIVKPHTVRKWLLGLTQPKSETLLLLANWLKVDPKDLIAVRNESITTTNNCSFEFDFTDQEVISKYLSMTVKQKVTIRLLIDAITDKGK